MKENYRELSSGDLQKEIENTRAGIREKRFQFAVTRSLENTKAIRDARKKIARLLTFAKEKELDSKGLLKKNPGQKKETKPATPPKGKKK